MITSIILDPITSWPMPDSAFSRHLPLKAVDASILVVLAREPLHGYGLVKAIEEDSDGAVRLEPGNLYRYIRRLVDVGLVAKADRRATPESADERRQYYRITSDGMAVLAAETRRLRSLVAAAEGALESPG